MISFFLLLVAFLKARWLPYSVTVLLMAIGTTTIVMLLGAGDALQKQFTVDAKGIDMVVGAKGSPLQLVLSSVYHVDVPTGNILEAEANDLCSQPEIRACVPLALGDTYRGFRIVGTDVDQRDWALGLSADMIAAIPANILPLAPMEAIVGYEVAQATGLKVGSRFVGTHGLIDVGHAHGNFPYIVKGVLPRVDTVLDRVILTSVETVQKIHAEEAPQALEEITAVLVQVASPRLMMVLPRWINSNSIMQAAHPATEITRLYSMLGGGLDSLRVLSFAMIGAALLSLFIVLSTSLQQRLPDLAMLRVLGWRRSRISALVLAEGLVITVVGLAIGLAVALLALPSFAAFSGLPLATISADALLTRPVALLAVCILVLAVLACLLPVLKVYRVSIAATLGK